MRFGDHSDVMSVRQTGFSMIASSSPQEVMDLGAVSHLAAIHCRMPLFDWGKFYERDGRVLLPFSVQVHHSFVDGIHIGQFAEILQDYLNAPS